MQWMLPSPRQVNSQRSREAPQVEILEGAAWQEFPPPVASLAPGMVSAEADSRTNKLN